MQPRVWVILQRRMFPSLSLSSPLELPSEANLATTTGPPNFLSMRIAKYFSSFVCSNMHAGADRNTHNTYQLSPMASPNPDDIARA